MADLQTVERKMERLSSALKGDKKLQPTMEMVQELREHLVRGKPASYFPDHVSETFLELEDGAAPGAHTCSATSSRRMKLRCPSPLLTTAQ